MGDRHVKMDEKEKMFYIDSNVVYGCTMSQSLLCDEKNFVKIFKLENILKTPCYSDIGYFVECDLKHPDEKKRKTKIFPICPENKTSFQDKFSDYMNEMKPKTSTQIKR